MAPSFINESNFICPIDEIVGFEALFNKIEKPTFKAIREKLQGLPPSHYLRIFDREYTESIRNEIYSLGINSFSYLIKGTAEYPAPLLSLENQLEVIYYKGDISLVSMPSVAVVGSRNASEWGIMTAMKIAARLTGDKYAVVSGLAAGIDRAAHTAAIQAGGKTIAVIGTPLTESYPKENSSLQAQIAREHLLISQIPFIRYKNMHFKSRRWYFPERNKTMAALTKATIIVEASETSGTRTQARECIKLKKKLIFLKPALEKPGIAWPAKMVSEGKAEVAETYSDIAQILES